MAHANQDSQRWGHECYCRGNTLTSVHAGVHGDQWMGMTIDKTGQHRCLAEIDDDRVFRCVGLHLLPRPDLFDEFALSQNRLLEDVLSVPDIQDAASSDQL